MTRRANASTNNFLPFFPLFVDLRNKTCLVVGAGTVAATKIESLLCCGARIEVVSPGAVRAISDRASEGTITWHRRRFASADVRGKFLVIAATGSVRTNRTIFRASTAHGILCNSVDDPQRCNFFFPALVRRGPLQIAISTGGCSPSLAARMRRDLEIQFGPEWGKWVEHLGKLRSAILARQTPALAPRRRLEQIATPQAFRAFLRAGARRKSATARKKPR